MRSLYSKCLTLLIAAAILWAACPLIAAYGANYKISAQVIDAGGARGSSASYQLIGKAREHGLNIPSSTNFRVGEGFLKSAYFAFLPLGPLVTSIEPSSAENSQPVSVTIFGANFLPGAAAWLSLTGETSIAAAGVSVETTGKITCTFDITGAASGLWNVTVTNLDGRSGTLPSAFTINPSAPQVTGIVPNKGYNNGVVNITNLSGSNFRTGASVKLRKAGEADIDGENVAVVSGDKITCSFDLTRKAVGLWDVVVTCDIRSGTLARAFKIEEPGLIVTVPVKSEKNPFDPSTGPTKLTYSLNKDADITLYIFNMRGERVWEYTAPAGGEGGKLGVNEVIWDGTTAFRAYASIGVYFVRVTVRKEGQIKTLSTTKIAVVR